MAKTEPTIVQNFSSKIRESLDFSSTKVRQKPENPYIHRSRENSVKILRDSEFALDEFIFDSITIHFNVEVFIQQLLSHVFLIFAPFFTNMRMQGFFNTNWAYILNNYIVTISMYIGVIAYLLLPFKDRDSLGGAPWMSMIYFLQYRMVIALKYASLSESEYEKLYRNMDAALNEKFVRQIQILNDFAINDPVLMKFELASAATRISAQINEISLTIPNHPHDLFAMNELHQWNSFVRGHPVLNSNTPLDKQFVESAEGYSMSVYDLCTAILTQPDNFEGLMRFENMYILGYTLLHTGIPWISVATQFDTINFSMQMFMLLVAITIVSICVTPVVYKILFVSLYDAARLLQRMTTLHEMMRLSDLNGFRSKVAPVTRSSSRASSFSRKASQQGSPGESGKAKVNGELNVVMSMFKPFQLPQDSTAAMENALHRFYVLGRHLIPEGGPTGVPRISFHFSQNVVAWTYCRLTLQYYGERFQNRLEYNTAGACMLIMGLIVFKLIDLILAEDRLSKFSTVLFMQTSLAVAVMLGVIVIIISIGALVNEELHLHSRTMAAHLLRVRDEIQTRKLHITSATLRPMPRRGVAAGDLTPEMEVAHLEEVAEQLESCLVILEANTMLKPYKVFGLTATSSLVFSILSTAITFYSVLLSLYSSATPNEEEGV